MCGIAGMISPDPQGRIGPALAAIEHRGRDDEGVYLSDVFDADGSRACLGHRRLAIIDTSAAGHQPMLSDDSRFAIILNGEIYNYLALRAELEQAGTIFKTQTDTEVLLAAFRKWGVACLEKLNGMFAFAVWDDREKQLTLVRDRAGIKPLYFAQIGNGLVFASEIKAILATGYVAAEIDQQALDQFLTFLWPVPPNTMFRGIEQIMPGHFIVWKDGAVSQREWWDLDLGNVERGTSEAEWTDRVLETLDRVTQMEMIADVPLGAFLSGGVDSSSIVALMAKHSSEPVSTYTTGISKHDLEFDIIPDDVEWSRRVAELVAVNYHETTLTPDLTELIPRLVWHMDAPVIDMAIPSYLISKQARETQTVMLSGMGGDEIFAGYPRQMAMAIAAATDVIPTGIRRPLMHAIDSILYGGVRGRFTATLRNAKKFARSAAMDFEDRYLGFGTYFSDDIRSRLYSDDLKDTMSQFDPYAYHRQYFERSKDWSPLNRLLYVDFKTFMPALNLDTTDRTSMAAHLEVRVPFLNKEIVELAAKIPSELKIKGLKRKYILKKAAEKLLPKEVVWRKKAGFSAPVRSWLRGELRPMVDDLLSEDRVRRRGIFDPAEVRRIIDLNLAGREDLNLQVFQLMTFELWLQAFID